MDSGNSAAGGDGGGGASSNSSDFVRKLFKMLEDPSHREIVRWSEAGDSFIVVDVRYGHSESLEFVKANNFEQTNDFTKNILPKHFKHCNFASFVRQLNKYDFHKIRNYDAGGGNQHQAWEFKHPDFQMHNKDNLDNIRRKAPAPRKQQQQTDEAGSQQVEVLQNQVRELSKIQNSLEGRLQKLTNENNAVIQELNRMQETWQTHETQIQAYNGGMEKLISYLWKLDAEIKGLRQAGGLHTDQPRGDGVHPDVVSPVNGNAVSVSTATPPNGQNRSSTPTPQVQRIINGFAEIPKSNPSLQHMGQLAPPDRVEPGGGYDNYNTVNRHSQAAQRPTMQNGIQGVGPDGSHLYGMDSLSGMGEVYNNGQGGSMGFAMAPPQSVNGSLNPPGRPIPGRKKSAQSAPGWTQPPRVLLVEDDPTCARIGSKFLQAAQCGVDMANDGLVAVNKLGHNKYDLVLMDIVMPHLDGVSAAALIRQFDKETPIIAMTSNIRSDDIQTYFDNGMNDVLPKPFTKEGLLKLLERILGHLKANKDTGQIPPQLSFNGPENRIIEENGGVLVKAPTTLKYPHSQSKSPQICGPYGRSPTDMREDQTEAPPPPLDDGSYLHMMGPYVDNTHDQGNNFPSPANSSRGTRRGASEMDDHPHHLVGVDIKKPRY